MYLRTNYRWMVLFDWLVVGWICVLDVWVEGRRVSVKGEEGEKGYTPRFP